MEKSDNKVYGYCRISTSKQKLERQVNNIKQAYPNAVILKEVYTGSDTEGREVFQKLVNKAKQGDTIVFDEVSRMSRNAEEGVQNYMELYSKGVELVFLKEPHINTAVYKKALQGQISMTGDKVDYILEGINKYLMALAEEQIKIAFDKAQAELDRLHERTREGIKEARRQGVIWGRPKGTTYHRKEEDKAREAILKHCKAFGGTLKDVEVMRLADISRATYFKYKKILLAERQEQEQKEADRILQ